MLGWMPGDALGTIGGNQVGDILGALGAGAEDVSIGETVGAKVMGWVLRDPLRRVDGTSVGGKTGGLFGGLF